MDRYEEAFERAKELYSKFKCITAKNVINVIEEIFPQLKESEDEKVEKAIFAMVYDSDNELWSSYGVSKGDVLAWLDRPSEENHADKVEPEFKIGDWVVSPNGVYWHIDAIRDGRYQVSSDSGVSADWPLDTNIYHKFTIQDAKDGDVLAALNYILIFKEFLKNDGGISYCHYAFGDGNPQFIWSEDKNWYFGKEAIIHPATKEQRDTLMKAMADAGFTFDFDKKELKKIEQKPAWSEEDETALGDALWCCEQAASIAKNENDLGTVWYAETWLKSLKDRVQPQPKQEWSEEDEKILKSIINDLSQNVVPDKEDIDWLKSIKDRYTWTPSDEDKKMLDFAIRAVGLCKQYAINHQVNGYSKLPDTPKRYEELQNWLKSLKPQSAWRPTDKQMKELERASWSQNFDRDAIEELYDDLKKL